MADDWAMTASSANDGLTRNQRYEFRLMAAHPDVVEEVIAESTDADPPTRRKVIRAIREFRGCGYEPGVDAVLRVLARAAEDAEYEPVSDDELFDD